MALSKEWKHTYLEPCPICGRQKSDNRCLFIPDAVVLCYYTPSKLERDGTAGKAYLHFLKDRPERERPAARHRIVRTVAPKASRYDYGKLAGKFQLRMTPNRLQSLSRFLGLSMASLKLLRVGWTDDEPMWSDNWGEERPIKAWSFPRVDDDGRVIGIGLRPMYGRKFAWTDSDAGLHVPTNFQPGGRGVCTEGPTDTGAALDLGLNVFGRTSCYSDVDRVIAFIRRQQLQQFIIFSQCDEIHYRDNGEPYWPAQDGAETLAQKARLYVPDVRIILPPPASLEDKDVRDWRRNGATAVDVEHLINQAAPRMMRVAVSIYSKKGNGVCHTKTI